MGWFSREDSHNANADDAQAIARYRYLLRTAPPEAIEQAHAEAFAQLTPEQRRQVLRALSDEMPDHERVSALGAGDDPLQLARVATRTELRKPGVMERVLGRFAAPMGMPSMGGVIAQSLLGSMAGTVLGTMIGQHFMHANPGASSLFDDSTTPHDAGSAGMASMLGADDVGGVGGFASDFDSGDIGGIDTSDIVDI
jgi:hypothetical protein